MKIDQTQQDDEKLEMLSRLRACARMGEYWQTANAVAVATGHSRNWTEKLLNELLFDGWLQARDGDNSREKLLYRLRAEYC